MKNSRYTVIVIGLLLMFSCSRQGQEKKYVIQRGEFQASLTETGELQAVVAKHIVMPFLGPNTHTETRSPE